MLLGFAKDEHFSYFHSSCQLGLRSGWDEIENAFWNCPTFMILQGHQCGKQRIAWVTPAGEICMNSHQKYYWLRLKLISDFFLTFTHPQCLFLCWWYSSCLGDVKARSHTLHVTSSSSKVNHNGVKNILNIYKVYPPIFLKDKYLFIV